MSISAAPLSMESPVNLLDEKTPEKKTDVDPTAIRCAIIRSLRGDLSQAVLNKRLGFNFNQLSRWEQGRTRIYWHDFVRLCEACDRPFPKILKEATARVMSDVSQVKILKLIFGEIQTKEASAITNIPRQKIERWLREETAPTLEDVIHLTASIAHYVHELYYALIDSKLFPEYSWLAAPAQYKDLVARDPRLSLARSVLASEESIPRGRLADALRISLRDEEHIIHALKKVGVVEEHEGNYRLCESTHLLSTRGPDFSDHQRLVTYWLKEASRCLDAQKEIGHDKTISNMSFIVCNLSSETYQKMQDRYRDFFVELGALLRADKNVLGKKDPRVIAIQFFDPVFAR